jgi:hypothetical protein
MVGAWGRSPNRRDEKRERERTVTNGTCPPPLLSPWTLLIGEVERAISILFHWWSEILQVDHQTFITKLLKTVIRSLYF